METTREKERSLARAIAFYLPQFHPIPENDEWWGAGFTEWTNVRAARPLYEGHDQPVEPGELGYYDLRSAETRQAQADLAREHGIEAFCYWHYWFAGHRLLEGPFEEVLRTGEPDFPFCLAWANHSWTAAWVGRPYQMLMEQTYPGRDDYVRHFEAVLPAFEDPRYVRVDGRPLFLVFRPRALPDARAFTDLWRELAVEAGLSGLHLLGIMEPERDPAAYGLDGSVALGIGHLLANQPPSVAARIRTRARLRKVIERPLLAALHQAIGRAPRFGSGVIGRAHDRLARELLFPLCVDYERVAEGTDALPDGRFPCVTPNWDNTPRMGRWGTVVEGTTPLLYERALRRAVAQVQSRPADERLVFLKSWNEWAEGNYLEPDQRNGRAYLEASRRALSKLAD